MFNLLCYHRNDNFDDIDFLDEECLWDENYLVSFDRKEDLFDTTHAADYLRIKPLLNLTACFIADNIRDKTADEIRSYFNIPYPEDEDDCNKNQLNPKTEEEHDMDHQTFGQESNGFEIIKKESNSF